MFEFLGTIVTNCWTSALTLTRGGGRLPLVHHLNGTRAGRRSRHTPVTSLAGLLLEERDVTLPFLWL
jgi:hypothetical protein